MLSYDERVAENEKIAKQKLLNAFTSCNEFRAYCEEMMSIEIAFDKEHDIIVFRICGYGEFEPFTHVYESQIRNDFRSCLVDRGIPVLHIETYISWVADLLNEIRITNEYEVKYILEQDKELESNNKGGK